MKALASRWLARAAVRAALAGGAGALAWWMGPTVASAQQAAGYVVLLPLQGAASEALLHDAEEGVRAALVARGLSVADRNTVRGAMGVAVPSDTTGIVGFGRGMGATLVVAGTVRPIAGQYQIELRLYEVSSQRVATVTHAVGIGDEAAEMPPIVATLFAPNALQASPEEQARLAAEQRARDEQARHDREEQARRDREREEQAAREERARQAQETREREAREQRNAWASGGRVHVGAGLTFGGRITSAPARMEGLPAAAGLVAGGRVEAGYAAFPSAGPVGIELGGAAQLYTSPTVALMFAATGRVVWPARGWSVPLRGSVGVLVGPFFSITGARQVSAWLGFDVRGEYDITQNVGVFASLGIEGAPSILGALGFTAGARIRFGEPARYPSLATEEPEPEPERPRRRRRTTPAPETTDPNTTPTEPGPPSPASGG